MDGTIIDLAIKKAQWLLDHPEVTWSGSGIYLLSLTGTAVLAVAACVRRRKKKSSADSKFTCNGGEQNSAQGGNSIGKQVNNYNNVSPDVLADVRKLAVTDSALVSFFKILEDQQVPHGDLDSKLREIAFRHKELLQHFESVTSDDPQVQALKEQAGQAIENGDYDRADDLLNQAKERDRAAVATLKASLAEQQAALEKRQLSEAESCVGQAMMQRLQYRYEKSAQYFQEAAAALPEGYEAERATYLGAAGYDLLRIARYAEALSLYEQSLSIRYEIGDRNGEAKSLNNISQIYQNQGDYGKALEYLEQSLLLFREVGDKEGEGATLNNIAMLASGKSDYSKVLTYLEQSLLLAREVGDKEGEGTTLNNIGLIHDAQGDYNSALQYYQQALAISREIKDKRIESSVLNNIGQVYDAQENYNAAFKLYEQSLAISQQIGDRQGEGRGLNNIAAIYQAKGDYSAALKQYEPALSIAKEIGNKNGEATYSWNIGALYIKQGELTKAEPYLSRAVELKEKLEHPMLENAREALAAVRAMLWGK